MRGYAVGTRVLEAVLPAHNGPTAVVPVEMGDRGLDEKDGVGAKDVVLEQPAGAIQILAEHRPARVLTLGDLAHSDATFFEKRSEVPTEVGRSAYAGYVECRTWKKVSELAAQDKPFVGVAASDQQTGVAHTWKPVPKR